MDFTSIHKVYSSSSEKSQIQVDRMLTCRHRRSDYNLKCVLSYNAEKYLNKRAIIFQNKNVHALFNETNRYRLLSFKF